ncbi:phosphatase PAP2 family protein [Polyangium jinanense]|uniref:Phosphatase PAP2 family protein n=1 Tax=Polyangium jinanense TaxID=2829994 RepID=A0A9X3XDV5_9BACT|nr:phosphatase PAP2 family protein [Polyangium jinanense]MDC3961232.1 phosphatase PAP2 family protein [Polyangium jinanense]MDC3988574.1 phosphatase PAP2 family protein [Polyangium jinanense]
MSPLDVISAADEALLRAVRGSPAWATPLFVAVTFVGGGWGMFALVPFLAREKTRATTTRLIAALVVTSALVSTVKAVVGRVRPCDALAACEPVFITSPGGHSFPSGHAAGSFAFAAFVASVRPVFAVPAFVFAALVAWSRCFLAVHYPSDILAGALLGMSIGFVAARLRFPLDLKGSSRSGSRSPASSRPAPGGTGTPD